MNKTKIKIYSFIFLPYHLRQEHFELKTNCEKHAVVVVFVDDRYRLSSRYFFFYSEKKEQCQ
jgi:hypothetical protein